MWRTRRVASIARHIPCSDADDHTRRQRVIIARWMHNPDLLSPACGNGSAVRRLPAKGLTVRRSM
jgi:hypothetical protein